MVGVKSTLMIIKDNNMSPLSVTLFTACFIVSGIFFGKMYIKMHIPYNIWLAITITVSTIFIIELIIEKIFSQKKQE